MPDPLGAQFKPAIDTTPGDYPSYIWVDDSMQKVLSGSGTPTTTHWFTGIGTQNEFVSLQVHILAPKGGIPSYKVDLASLTNVQTGTVISSPTYNIMVYREAYMTVATKTSVANTYYNSTGTYPDILIPTQDNYWNQVTTAFPVALSSGQVSSAWIDVLLPTGAPSGFYLGGINVTSAGVTLANLPILITVVKWPAGLPTAFMPSTATLKSYFAYGFAALCSQQYGGPTSAGCAAYPGATSDDNGAALVALDATYWGLDHRISITSPYPPSVNATGFNGASQFVGLWGPLLDGTGSRIKQMLPQARPTSILYTDTTYSSTTANLWTSSFVFHGWNTNSWKPGDYTCDEANCTNPQFISSATLMHLAATPMATLWTTNLGATSGSNTTNYLDIFVPHVTSVDKQAGGLVRSSYTAWLQSAPMTCGTNSTGACPAHQFWSYGSCTNSGTCTNGTPGGSSATWPNYNVDGKPVANRIFQWLAWYRLDSSGELYYNATICWTNGGCSLGTNPLQSVYYSGGYGDGTIMYPGTTAYLGASVTKPIYLSSVRSQHIRNGFQDYEIFNVLKLAGLTSLVQAEMAKFITNSYTFNTDPNNNGSYTSALMTSRANLLCNMHQLSYPGSTCGT